MRSADVGRVDTAVAERQDAADAGRAARRSVVVKAASMCVSASCRAASRSTRSSWYARAAAASSVPSNHSGRPSRPAAARYVLARNHVERAWARWSAATFGATAAPTIRAGVLFWKDGDPVAQRGTSGTLPLGLSGEPGRIPSERPSASLLPTTNKRSANSRCRTVLFAGGLLRAPLLPDSKRRDPSRLQQENTCGRLAGNHTDRAFAPHLLNNPHVRSRRAALDWPNFPIRNLGGPNLLQQRARAAPKHAHRIPE